MRPDRQSRLMRLISGRVGAVGVFLLTVLALLGLAYLTAGTGMNPSSVSRPASGDVEPSAQSEPSPDSSELGRNDFVPPEVFSTGPRANRSTTEAELIGVDTGIGKGVETVTFTFTEGERLPLYRVEYVDEVRLHPDDDPTPVGGNAYLLVAYELTDPNQANRLAFSPRITADQPQIAEVLLFDNLGGNLKFAIGLESKALFRIRTPDDPTRLIIEIKAP